MSELGGMLGNLTPVTHNPASDAAAVRAVLRRVDTGQLDRAGAREILEVLGLVEPAPEPLPPAPSPRPAQVLERDPASKRFKSPQAPGEAPHERGQAVTLGRPLQALRDPSQADSGLGMTGVEGRWLTWTKYLQPRQHLFLTADASSACGHVFNPGPLELRGPHPSDRKCLHCVRLSSSLLNGSCSVCGCGVELRADDTARRHPRGCEAGRECAGTGKPVRA